MATLTQSCVETQFFETTTVRLKLNASPQSLEIKNNNNQKVENLGGWSFLQSLSNVSSSNPKQYSYFSSSSSSRRLSEKSLELCTENLGCETGSSDTMASNILSFSSSPRPSPSMEEKNQRKNEKDMEYSHHHSCASPKINKVNKINNNTTDSSSRKSFPPPLTTMSGGAGSSSFKIRPHREDGRLVITAVEAPPRPPCFKAERSQGRLTLTFVEIHAPKFDSDDVMTGDEENDEIVEDDCEESVELDSDFSTINEDHNRDRDGDDDEESGAYVMSKGINGNVFEIEGEMGMENFRKMINGGGRCIDRGLCNWEPALWVATS